ncbi:MAG: DEAD/DEAH box helicase family protein [Clostridia bacterium]|nr:DEAD/DEAH box helicase family protein [Clostridia bacterium]MCI8729526.1 DEAD/DEAH box helicase family protein [Clostridia bacterium]
MFLYEKIDTLKEVGLYSELPQYIKENLNPVFELRPYQVSAFCNYITYFENQKLRQKPTQTLFHMATGSGKTLIMAGLILYLYKKGYRNFLFFVNLSNIVRKTKENFLAQTSSKYLFAENIIIDGEHIKIKEVSNFQNTDADAINICFTTIQGLHSDMWAVKENCMSFDDFKDKKVVLISDEAHHLSASTKKQDKDEQENERHWEYTVNRIFGSDIDNILLEFTATCDIKNSEILAKYENKIIFNYPLAKFREELYSKEIKTLRTDSPVFDRSLQAVLLSQYRLKVFQDHRLNIKPIILLKSHRIKENAHNMASFIKGISLITGDKIQEIFDVVRGQVPIMQEAYEYFISNGISFEQLAQEIKDDFSATHCISANDDKELEKNQLLLNSLEDKDNPYRAVFAVDKLNEGWDVLNLFDIVRLYETRDGKNGKPGAGTISEAQLIGRGARYCPFRIDKEQNKFQRKYDNDVDNQLRICETLYYHCWNEPRYISELHTALREVGLDLEGIVTKKYQLKEAFRNDDLYRTGYVFTNERVLKSRNDVNELLPSVKKPYDIVIAVGKGGEDVVLDEVSSDISVKTYQYITTFGEIASINYSTVNRALRQFDVFKFNTLISYFPNVKSTYEFVMNKNYLGDIQIKITSKYQTPPMSIIYRACVCVLSKIASKVASIEEVWEGTTEFKAHYLHEYIKDKSVNYMPVSGSKGMSQNDPSVGANRLDLSCEDWFVFDDNYGTSEEKAFVRYFKDYVDTLHSKYDKIYLIRNERQIHLYSFDGGERFEPDYILYLCKNRTDSVEQLIVFVEPKGTIYIDSDKWKEDFLLELKDKAVPTVTFVDDNKYKIWGFHFFNTECRSVEFNADMETL